MKRLLSTKNSVLMIGVVAALLISPLSQADQRKHSTDNMVSLTSPSKKMAQSPSRSKSPTLRVYKVNNTVKESGEDKETALEIHGYIKTDFIYDIGVKGGDVINYQNIPVGPNSNENGHVRFHARQTRINFKKTITSPLGPVTGFIEGDFLGSGGTETLTNSTVFRIRHAYSTVGNWLLGQSWSTFVDVKSYPETIDLGNAAGQALIRQSQIRYSRYFDKNQLLLSLENAETDVNLNQNPNELPNRAGQDKKPDVVIRAIVNKPWGHISAQYVYRTLGVYSKSLKKTFTNNGHAWALSARRKIAERDDIRLYFSEGVGAGRYIQESTGLAADFDQIDGQPAKLRLNKSKGAYLAYRHWWSDRWRSNIALGYARVNHYKSDVLKKDVYHTALFNLFHPISKELEIGIEYAFGKRRETTDGTTESGYIKRLQFSTKFSF
ncbi:hypothetical protein JYU12_01170 [bacterium AH-315-K03]|nr:hypothetical protein [bacterium AH-315-K03]